MVTRALDVTDHTSQMRPYLWSGAALQMGLRPTTQERWTLIGKNHVETLKKKRARLASAPQSFYRSMPESFLAQAELCERLVEHLTRDHAEHFTLIEGRLQCASRREPFDVGDTRTEPLAQIAQFVEEDFMLLQPLDDRLVITAAANAYSSSGRLVDSVGYDVPWAHIPVPGLQAQLGKRIDRVLASVHVDFPSERFNWLITPIAELFFPLQAHAQSVLAVDRVVRILREEPQKCGDLLWIRCERQTLMRLPNTGAIAFGIHTCSDPLASIRLDCPSLRAIHDLLSEFSAERLQYLGMERLKEPVLAWIRERLA